VKIERGRKSFERKFEPERAIKNIVARILSRLKFRIATGERLQDRHQRVVGRIPCPGVARD